MRSAAEIFGKKAVQVDNLKGTFGFFKGQFDSALYTDCLYAIHLWLYHILIKVGQERRARFSSKYTCLRDLNNLFKVVILSAITKGNIEHGHDSKNRIITVYSAFHREAVGSFIHPTEGRLYQFIIKIVFRNGKLCPLLRKRIQKNLL